MPFDTLPPLLGDALAARGYETLTPVQAAVTDPDGYEVELLEKK